MVDVRGYTLRIKSAEGDELIWKIYFCGVDALILEISLSIFCYPNNVAILICQILMPRALTSHTVMSTDGHVSEDNIYTNVIN